MEWIARAQQIRLLSLDDDQSPRETGFGLLGFAVPVARPEGDLGIDPFTISDARVLPTIGDFIKAYENVLA